MVKENKRPSELFLKRVRKIVLLFKVKHKQWENLANLSQLPMIENDLKELVQTSFLKKGKTSRFVLTEKGRKVIEVSRPFRTEFQEMFPGYCLEEKQQSRKRRKKNEKRKH